MPRTRWSRTDQYDAIINRHLVWTLVDPTAAFAEWLRILKPGGTLLIVDGDFVSSNRMERLIVRFAAVCQHLRIVKADAVRSPDLLDTHRNILSRVHFSQGARADAVADLLRQTGFTDVTIDTNMRAIHRAQSKNFSLLKGWARATQHRYAIRARKGHDR